jgi:hypothetical protein
MQLQNTQLDFADALLSSDQQLDYLLPAQNIRIYQHNVMMHLLGALQKTYPHVLRLVGSDFFQLAAKAYVKQYPSRSGELNEYGEYFSDFLTEYQPVKDLIYLAEVAQFEWAYHLLLSAGTQTPLDITLLKNLAPEQYDQVHFSLHPACKVLKFYYPILRIMASEKEIDDSFDFGEDGIHLLMMRPRTEIELFTLTAGDFTFLAALQDNLTLAEALTLTLDVYPSFELNNKLSSWIHEHIIVDCYFA